MKKLFYRCFRANRPSRTAQYHNWADVRTVLVISNRQLPAFTQLDGTHQITYLPVPKDKEVSWYGRPCHEVLSQLETHYDLLIDLQLEQTLTGDYTTLYANADLKAGKRREGDLLDIMIDMDGDEQELYDQIVKYLMMIKG